MVARVGVRQPAGHSPVPRRQPDDRHAEQTRSRRRAPRPDVRRPAARRAGGRAAAAARVDVPGDAPEAEPPPAAGADVPATSRSRAAARRARRRAAPSFIPPRAHRDPLGDGPERPYYDGPDLAAAAEADTPRRLTRTSSDRLIAGVAGGLGRYFDVDPLIFRIAFVVLTFAGGFGLLAYLIGVVAIPADDEPSRSAGASGARSAPACSPPLRWPP